MSDKNRHNHEGRPGMHRLCLIVTMLLASLGIAPALAAECSFPQAREAGCVCTLAVDPAQAGPIARLTDMVGDVMVTNQAGFQSGFTPVSDGVDLYAGDGVAVPGDGAAVLNFGPECRQTLAPDTSLVLRQDNGCACAAVFGLGDVPVTTGATDGENDDDPAGVLVGSTLLATTLAILLALDSAGDSVSP